MKTLDREILRLALPSILAGITVPLVGMVDIAVAGHLQGAGGAAAFIGGISVGSMLFDLLYWNFYFLRAGTGGLTAQAFGRSDPRECARLLVRGVRVENDKELLDVRVTADALKVEPLYVVPFIAAPVLLLLILWVVLFPGKKKRR